jgi:hypothetical protein
MGLLLFSVFINELRDTIIYSRYLLFANIKIYRSIKFPEDFNMLHSQLDFVQGWCTANYTNLISSKTKVISISRKTNILIYEHKRFQLSVTRTDSIKTWEFLSFLIFIISSYLKSRRCT